MRQTRTLPDGRCVKAADAAVANCRQISIELKYSLDGHEAWFVANGRAGTE
jgi:hypothetical protein